VLDGVCAVEQWLATQAARDVAGLGGGDRGGISLVQAGEMLGVIEQAARPARSTGPRCPGM
jgi:hypothetical protein